MTERNTLILYGIYEEAFVMKAIQAGYVKRISVDNSYRTRNSASFYIWAHSEIDTDSFYTKNPYQSRILQMFLIYDKVIIVDPSIVFDYDLLTKTDFVEVRRSVDSIDNYRFIITTNLTVPETDQRTKEIASYLKPLVVEYLLKHFKGMNISCGISKRRFFSCLYDFVYSLEIDQSPEKSLFIIQNFLGILSQEEYDHYRRGKQDSYLSRETIEKLYKNMFITECCNGLRILATLLGLSFKEKGILSQNAFEMRGKKTNKFPELHHKTTLDAYQIVRISFENAIGCLPRLRSIEDVLRLKEKRSRDIKRLRSILNEIESSLREGKKTAIKSAENSIKKAANDLAWGNKIEKVSKWITCLSLPIGIIELLLSIPPATGLATSFVGSALTLQAENIERQNGWLQVIR